ncbi:MAG: sulfotransferase [Pseudomonadota bacterium]
MPHEASGQVLCRGLLAVAKAARNRASAPTLRTQMERALAAHRSGALDAAADLYTQVLARAPRHADALNLLGVLKMQGGDASAGLALVERAIKVNRRQPAYHNNRGEVLRALGRDAEALVAFESALKLDPRFTDASINAAFAACSLQRLDTARGHAGRALKGAPDEPETHMALAEVARLAGDAEAALEAARGAHRLTPNEPQILAHMAGSLAALGRVDEARGLLERTLAIVPGAVEPRLALADIALQAGDRDRASELALQAVRLAPLQPEVHRLAGDVATATDAFHEAVTHYEEARRLGLHDDTLLRDLAFALARCHRVDDSVALLTARVAQCPVAETHSMLARLLLQDGQGERALTHFSAALELAPDDALGTLHQGDALATLGRRDDAIVAVRRAITLDPSLAVAYETLAYIGGADALDAEHKAAAARLAEDPRLPPEARASAHFACAISNGGSFEHYAAGNRLMRDEFPFDLPAHRALVDRVVGAFPKPDSGKPAARGTAQSPRMVFIVGLPRSGTSLAEQILASHSRVFGAGEVEFFNHLRFVGATQYPESVAVLTDDDMADMRDAYLAPLARKAGGAAVVIDKMPGNYLYLGLVARLFPDSRVINMRRDPLDNCLSVFFQNFTAAAAHAYSFDLEILGSYYREYERLMAHWHAVIDLPVLDFAYEDLVASPEARSRQLLEFCELEWEPQVLEFHATQRDVNTASYLQVRQPIYRSAVERWRRYEEHLAPLRRSLGLAQDVG